MKRYDIHLARLDPVEGAEMAKTRPAVIVSLDILNKLLPTVVVSPLTTKLRPAWKTRIQIAVSSTRSDICVDQIRVLSKSRLGRKVGSLSRGDAETLRNVITQMYGEE